MIGLTASMAACGIVFLAALVIYHRTRASLAAEKLPFMAGFAAAVLVLSAASYAALGRWSDWQEQKVDREVNYLLAAKVTEAQRRVKNAPENIAAQIELAEAYLEVGRYQDAADVFDVCLTLGGPKAEIYARKAFALYYRDGRKMTAQARAAADQALALNKLDVQTRMLLGQDAFLNEHYAEAIRQWRMLLDSGAAPAQERALRNAIANAESRARKQD